ncbi:MAG TPA: hypothetical protein VMV69_13275 [Pirellulales bacterium]|nr:hypothetical protein [Pirellulales bacterium]
MTPAVATSYPPFALTDDLDRLAASPEEPGITPEFWPELHSEIQRQLALLEGEVRRQVPGVRVVGGRTRGEQFCLFSYLTFSMPDSDIDPVVVGITFTPSDEGVTVEADVSGERFGDLISTVYRTTVGNSTHELLAAACDFARELGGSVDAIRGALNDASRRVG